MVAATAAGTRSSTTSARASTGPSACSLIDPDRLSPDGSLGIRSVHPSPDGERVVYALRQNAADAATLYAREVDSGEDLPADVIPGARFAWPQWSPDARSFFYTGLPDDPSIPPAKLSAHATVRRHLIGTSPANDEILYGPTGDARSVVAPQLEAGGRFVLMHLYRGSSGASDVYFMDTTRDDGFWPLRVGTGARNQGWFAQGRFMMLTSEGAPHYRLLETDAHDPQRSEWRELVAERAQTLEAVGVMDGHLILSYLDEVEARVVIQRLSDGRSWPVELPGPGAVHGVWADHARRPRGPRGRCSGWRRSNQ